MRLSTEFMGKEIFSVNCKCGAIGYFMSNTMRLICGCGMKYIVHYDFPDQFTIYEAG